MPIASSICMERTMLLLVIIVMLINSNGSTEAFMGNSNNNNNNIMERPVKLRIHKQAVQKVRTLIPKEDKNAKNAKKDPTWLLQEYMQLPAAQYACVPLPIKASLERVYGQSDEFALQVPTIRFPISTKTGDIEITPTVRVKVRVEPDRVIIRSISCSIEGSPAVEEWKLNDRYDLDVCATLTWEKQRQGLLHFLNDDDRGDDDEEEDDDDDDQYDHDMGASSKSQTVSSSFHRLGNKSKTLKRDSRRATAASASSSSPASSPLASSLESDPDCLVRMDPNSQDIIRIKTDLAIDVYPPNVKRIKMIPKRLLAKIGNSVMNYVVGLLLEAFLQGLQEDYEKWACDGAYRTKRRLLEEELQLELKALAESRRKKKEQEERQLRRQEQRRRRQQPPRPANRNDDGDGGGGSGGANNPAFPFHHHLPVGFLQRRRDAATAAAAVGTLPNRPNLRRGERIIRLIRRTNRSVVG